MILMHNFSENRTMKLSIIDSHKMVQFRFKVDNFFEAKLALGAGDANYSELLRFQFLAYFNNLMRLLQSFEED